MHMLKKNKNNGKGPKNPTCLVLSPTRELAVQVDRYPVFFPSYPCCNVEGNRFLFLYFCLVMIRQISDVLSEAGEPCGLKSICVYGGSSKRPQINAIRSGVVRLFLSSHCLVIRGSIK